MPEPINSLSIYTHRQTCIIHTQGHANVHTTWNCTHTHIKTFKIAKDPQSSLQADSSTMPWLPLWKAPFFSHSPSPFPFHLSFPLSLGAPVHFSAHIPFLSPSTLTRSTPTALWFPFSFPALPFSQSHSCFCTRLLTHFCQKYIDTINVIAKFQYYMYTNTRF